MPRDPEELQRRHDEAMKWTDEMDPNDYVAADETGVRMVHKDSHEGRAAIRAAEIRRHASELADRYEKAIEKLADL